ncbi:porin, partial [Fusobacterium nucleatum]
TKGNITVKNNDDGSGTYNDKDKDLLIENDGKGKAIITLKGKSTEVEAKPLEKPEKFPKLKMVPPVPSIEANSLLITLDSGILFDVDKYDVRPEAERALASLATVLKEADVKAFEIDGHTDSDASDEYNQALSEKRANAVKDFLASQGLTSEITIIGYGESRPVASNDTPEGKQKNRRVEILIPTI